MGHECFALEREAARALFQRTQLRSIREARKRDGSHDWRERRAEGSQLASVRKIPKLVRLRQRSLQGERLAEPDGVVQTDYFSTDY